MTIEVGLLFSAIACIIGAVTFFAGRQTAAKSSGEEWGELKSDIKNIDKTVSDIKVEIKLLGGQYSEMRTDVEVVKRDLKTAFNKIDDLRERGTHGQY